MRESPFDARRSMTMTLLIANIAAFLLQFSLYRFAPSFRTNEFFALSLWGIVHGYFWQPLTFQFMHAGLLHLLVNCWVIYVFGRDVEEAIGPKSFTVLYLGGGVLGGLVQALAGFLPGGHPGGAVVGASAGAFALTAAFAMLFPNRILLLFFIIPMRAKFLLLLSALIGVYGILVPTDNVAHAAHLGGMAAGVIFIRYAIHWQLPRLRRPSAPRKLVKVSSLKSAWGFKPTPTEDLPADEFLSQEVDPILDKISAQGIQSLTERERRVLEAARQKMSKR